MKLQGLECNNPFPRRPPRGGRGLKRAPTLWCPVDSMSPPARGAWIETWCLTPVEGFASSPPARGAWIETAADMRRPGCNTVAPRAVGVD